MIQRAAIIGDGAMGTVCAMLLTGNGISVRLCLSTVLLFHGTFTINSLCHVFGHRRFATRDTSRNSMTLALLTCGEGWHNNHHHHPSCARQGFYWWEIDITYYILRGMQAVGLVWDIKEPPARVYRRAEISRDESTRFAA